MRARLSARSAKAHAAGKNGRLIKVAKLCGVLASPVRLKIFALLSTRDMPTKALQLAIRTAQSNLSTHLRIMQDSGVILRWRDGPQFIYGLSDSPAAQDCRRLHDLVMGAMATAKVSAQVKAKAPPRPYGIERRLAR